MDRAFVVRNFFKVPKYHADYHEKEKKEHVGDAAWARERPFCRRKMDVKIVFFLVKRENFQ